MLLQYFSAHPRSIFLTDGLGALMSTLLLLVLAYFEHIFGMPKHVLYKLAPVTAILITYSLGLYLLNPKDWKRYLAPLAIANILYSCLTIVLLLCYFNKLTGPGIAYFSLEVIVILLLSGIELRLIYNKV